MSEELANLEWFTLRELANRWRTSAETLRRQCETETLRAMKVGGQWRVHESVVSERENAAKVATARKARDRDYASSGIDHFADRE